MVQDTNNLVLVNLDQWFSKAFTEFIIEGMYRYVREGPPAPASVNSAAEQPRAICSNDDLEIVDSVGRSDSVDLLKLNLPARLLVVLSNVSYLQGEGLRKLLAIFTAENVQISPNTMISALANVERAVTQLFLQGQIGRVIGPIESDWLHKSVAPSSDLYSLSPAIYKSLLSLADVQSLISDISLKDPLPLLRDLANSLISSLLNTIKSNVNISADPEDKNLLIQAKIDVEFVKKRFEGANLLSIESLELIDKINSIIDCESVDFYEIWGKFENNWSGPFSNLFTF